MLKSEITMLRSVKEFIRQPYAWPGGYRQALIMGDGGCLCHECARTEFRRIAEESFSQSNCGWRAAGVGVNWENTDLLCDHCGEQIEPAYGDDA